MEERIDAVYITDNETGVKYTLDFNRESVRFAESRGFKLENTVEFPVTGISDLFYYAFRMHHQKVARDKTDALLRKMKGVSESLLNRLMLLYQQAQTSNLIQTDEDAEKNAAVTVEL